MEDEENSDTPPIFTPSNLVTLSPIPPSSINPRRLSSRFSKPRSPIKAKPSLAWVSLQGRLIGADEATSSKTIRGSLSPQQAVAWELFSPIHRVLIVAVVAVAAAKCEKSRQIRHLHNCVQLRDQILLSMQQKLDILCEQMNGIKDQSQLVIDPSAPKCVDLSTAEAPFLCKSDSICTDCWLCDQHRAQLNDLQGNSLVKGGSTDEMFRHRLSISNDAEQEERRMSDLSDWASSVTSAADIQLNNLAIEQDVYNLKRECEEKDAAIKELSSFIRSKDVATSKRIDELEDIIRRKNTIISKLRKDMLILEQKVVSLTRMRRRSFPGPSIENKRLPTMTDNLVYDMDSPTGSSSSDSDCSSEKQKASTVKNEVEVTPQSTPVQSSSTCDNVTNRQQDSSTPESSVQCSSYTSENVTVRHQNSAPAKISSSSTKLSLQIPTSRPVTPLKEKSMNHRHNSAASPRLNQISASAGSKVSRRRSHQNVPKDAAAHKRWM